MTKPKRHHWWPMAQSKYWTDSKGLIFVTRANGTSFQSSPLNIGVESELYTRFGDDDEKDPAIEEWFSEAIDSPARMMIDYLLDSANVRRRPFRGDPSKEETVKQLGFRVNPYVDSIRITDEVRNAIASYIAALLVRNPTYLARLVNFHRENGTTPNTVRNRALDNMLYLHGVYADQIRKSALMITRRVESAEYLYADGGLIVREPWSNLHDMPFDIHTPLTPDIAIEVLPVPLAIDMTEAQIGEATDRGVARQNRIILGGAQRFVFSRQTPPIRFISKNFGRPAPKNIGYRIVDGRLDTRYEPSRH